MGHPGHMDALFEVCPLLLNADPALLRQKLSYLLLHPGPTIMSLQSLNGFSDSPVALHMHVFDQVLLQRGGANYPVPRKIISWKGGVLNADQDFTRRGPPLSSKVYEFECLSPKPLYLSGVLIL